jgi:Zn-dependent protease/CBS domain-containing protein
MSALRIARVSNIDIRVHWSFLLIVLLGAMQWGGLGARGAAFGAVLTLLIFASVTLHELGHSLVAQAFGIPVKHITLYPIGGVAQLGKRPKSPGQEFLIALAGPAVNVVLALVLGFVGVSLFGAEALWNATAHARVEQPTEVTLFAMLVSSNAVLALFNLLPALPMDGGRVLRAVLSWFFGAERATKVSATIARVLAAGLFVLGLFGNPMLAIIAAFIFFGAGQEVREQQLARVLDGVRAGDAVNPYAPRFTPNTTLGEAVQALIFTPYAAFAVEHFGRLVGVVTRQDLMAAANEQGAWGYVAGVMRRNVPVIDARDPLETARFKMEEAELPFVAVEREGMFLGLITEVELAQQALLAEQFARSSGPARRRGPYEVRG